MASTEPVKVEYRIRPVVRYMVTRYLETSHSGASTNVGEQYLDGETAYEVAYALCREEHRRLGWQAGDPRITYPDQPFHYRIEHDEFYGADKLVADTKPPSRDIPQAGLPV